MSQKTEIESEVLKIISKQLELPTNKINNETSIKNTPQWDSINHVRLVLSLQERFKIIFDNSEIANLTNIKKIINTIEKKTN